MDDMLELIGCEYVDVEVVEYWFELVVLLDLEIELLDKIELEATTELLLDEEAGTAEDELLEDLLELDLDDEDRELLELRDELEEVELEETTGFEVEQFTTTKLTVVVTGFPGLA
jgi:hypothetical protein